MKKKKDLTLQNRTDSYIALTGLCLVFGWAILLGVTDWLTHSSCALSPGSCTEGLPEAKLILYMPAIIGSILLPFGFVHSVKIHVALKLVIIALTSFVTLFIAFWLMVFAGIAIHGFGG